MTSKISRPKIRRIISLGAIALGGIGLLVIHPLCFCPMYYGSVSAICLLPVVLGPKAYRIAGVLMLVLGVLLASSQERDRELFEERQREIIRQSRNALP